MGDGDFKYCSVMKKIFCPGPIRAAKAGPKFLLYTGMMRLTKKINHKKGPLFYALLESPFASGPIVSRGHPSLVFLVVSNKLLYSIGRLE